LPYLYRRALPFLVIMAVGVLLITYLPSITTGVVRVVTSARERPAATAPVAP
jgi:hypothetical protein